MTYELIIPLIWGGSEHGGIPKTMRFNKMVGLE